MNNDKDIDAITDPIRNKLNLDDVFNAEYNGLLLDIDEGITQLLQSERNKTLELVRGAIPEKKKLSKFTPVWWDGYNIALDDISSQLDSKEK